MFFLKCNLLNIVLFLRSSVKKVKKKKYSHIHQNHHEIAL